MKLASLRGPARDGRLVVVSRDGTRWAHASAIVPTLQAALDDWDRCRPELERLAKQLERADFGDPVHLPDIGAPLPRAFEWIDGSAYLNHIVLVRKARGAEIPATLESDPLMYQGGSGVLLGPYDPIELPDESWGLDLEAELCVVLADTPRGTRAEDAAGHVRLVGLVNDVTFRNLVPGELAKGFGFFQSKPASAFSPFFVTPDELGTSFRDGRVYLPLRSTLNGALLGDPNAGSEMFFSFYDLVAHACRTRSLTAGTILGGGTVSNHDPARGVSCLAERRTREVLEHGAAHTPFLRAGDVVEIEMFGEDGTSVCGRIKQQVQST